MRGGTNWRSIIAAPEGHWAFSFLEVTDFDGTWVNLGNLAIGERNADFENSYDLEDDIDRNTLTFSASLRGSVGAFSIMPFRSDSPLNVDTAGSYQPLLDLHRQWRKWVCFTPRGTFPEGPEDYRERARGIVDRIDLSMARDEIRIQGRGPEADFIDDLVVCDETTPKVYAAGPVADVLQAMLDDRYGVATYTLVVDASAPSTYIDEITYTEPFSFWKVFSDVAAVGTGVVRFLYDASDNLAIHLFTPNRTATVAQWTWPPSEYSDIDNGLDLQTVANYIVVRFVNASGAIETVTSPTVDPAITPTASTARYGIKPVVMTLAPNIGLSDATRVQAMADAIRADRELPILGQVVKGSGLWLGELWDYVGTPANGVLYNEDQTGGVVGYHESGRNSVIDNVFSLAGKPKGRYATWLELDAGITPAADIAPGVTSSSATFKETFFDPVTIATIEFVCTVNDFTQSVDVSVYSDAALTTLVDTDVFAVTSAAPLAGSFAGMSGPIVRDTIYYVKITPYSGPLDGFGGNSGTAGPYALPNTNMLPEPTDTPTLTWDISDPAKLQANVVGLDTATTDIADIAAADVLLGTAAAVFPNGRIPTDTATVTWDLSTANQAKANASTTIPSEVAGAAASVVDAAIFICTWNSDAVLTNIASGAAEIDAARLWRPTYLSGFSAGRLVGVVTAAVALSGTAVEAGYSTDNGGSWTAITTGKLPLTVLGVVLGDWFNLPDPMRYDVLARVRTIGGNGTQTAKLSYLALQASPTIRVGGGTIPAGGGGGTGGAGLTPWDDNFDYGPATIDTAGTRFSGANPWVPFNLGSLATPFEFNIASNLLTMVAGTYTNSMEVRGYTQTIPSGNFRIRMPVTQPELGTQSYACAGIFLRESSTGKILAHVMGYDGGFRAQVRRLTSATGWYANYNYGTYSNTDKNSQVFLEVERSGSNLIFTSTLNTTDGNDLTTALATTNQVIVAQTTDFTTAPTDIGILINAEPLVPGNTAVAPWFLRLA